MITIVLDNYEPIAPIANSVVRCSSDTVTVWPYCSWSVSPCGSTSSVPQWLTRGSSTRDLYSWDSNVRESRQR